MKNGIAVKCETQAEVDALWTKLSDGGEMRQYGWIRDRFGVSWQVVPKVQGELLQDRSPRRAKNVVEAMLQITEFDIRELRDAHEER